LPPSALLARSTRIIEALEQIPCVRSARSVASFWPMEGRAEVDLRAFDRALEERGVARFYPFMDAKGDSFSTGFRRIQRDTDLQLRGRRFVEPPPDVPAAGRGDLDVVLVPALGVTPAGHRLGFGMGFYDATLPDVAPPAITIVVAFSFQVLGELFIESHDVACDLVVTDAGIYDPNGLLTGSPA
jgi:5-formyltetrahydrofolate cyclo-ligase